MSIEDTIKANTAAIEALTEAVKSQNATVEKALNGKTTTTKPAGTKPAATTKKTTKPKALTDADVRACFGPYLSGASDKATKARLIDTTKPLLEHFGVSKLTDIAEEQRAEAIEYGNMLKAAFDEGGIDDAEAVKFPFSEDQDPDEEEEDDDVL